MTSNSTSMSPSGNQPGPAPAESSRTTYGFNELVRVARLYYEDDLTQNDIGRLIGVPRIKVTRMLAEARKIGVVTFDIHGGDQRPFMSDEDSLRKAFALERCWIAATGASDEKTMASIARTGSAALADALSSAKTVAVSLSRAVAASVLAMPASNSPSATGPDFIPLGGSWGKASDGVTPHELVTVLAQKLNGRSLSFPAPVLAGDERLAQTFMEDPSVAQAMAISRQADTVITGIGVIPWTADGLLSELISDEQLDELIGNGAIGDISARFFDNTGTLVPSVADKRVVGMTLDQLIDIPHRIAIAFGPSKVNAIRAALTGGIINNLVTDISTARALLVSVSHQ